MARNAVRHYVSLAGKVIGLLVIGGPAIKAVTDHVSNPAEIPNWIIYNYTGYEPGTTTINFAQTAAGALQVAAGLILMKVFSVVARRF